LQLGQLENNSDAGDNSIKVFSIGSSWHLCSPKLLQAQQHALMSEMTRKLQQNSDGSSGTSVPDAPSEFCCSNTWAVVLQQHIQLVATADAPQQQMQQHMYCSSICTSLQQHMHLVVAV